MSCSILIPWGDKKKPQNFFKISQRVFVAQRSWKFQNMLQCLKFFLVKFLKLPNFSKATPATDFWLSTPKKHPKKAPITSKSIFFNNVPIFKMLPDFRYRGYIIVKNFAQKSFFRPASQKFFFGTLSTPKFWKKIFFDLKNLMVEVVSGAQKCIPEHFFECSKCPSYHMVISKIFFWVQNYGIWRLRWGQNSVFF